MEPNLLLIRTQFFFKTMKHKHHFLSIVLICLSFPLSLFGQETSYLDVQLDWKDNFLDGFEESFTTNDPEQLPLYMVRIPLSQGGTVQARLVDDLYEDVTYEGSFTRLRNHIKVHSRIEWERKKPYCKITFIPLKTDGNPIIQKLTSCRIQIDHYPQSGGISPRNNTYISALSDGDIYKISTSTHGIHKIGYDFLKNDLNIDIDNIDPRTIKILGNGGGSLPGKNSDFRHDDVVENAITIIGENDGSFNQNDYILFYAEGSSKKHYDPNSNVFSVQSNIYDGNNYYFIKISSGNGLRISEQPSQNNPTYSTNTFDDYLVFEENRYNLLKDYGNALGSGSQWFGDKFEITTEKDYPFSIPNIDTNEPIRLQVEMVARRSSSSSFKVVAGGEQFQSNTISQSNTSNPEGIYARRGIVSENFPASQNPNIKLTYNAPGGEAWLDFIRLNFRRNLIYNGTELTFRDANSIGQGVTEFQMGNMNGNIQIWDISNPVLPFRQQYSTSGNSGTFSANTESLKEFIAFDATGNFQTPTAIGSIPNQNLHQITDVDALLIYHKDFSAAAERFKEHRESHSGMSIAMADIDQVYNEFSSGSLDPLAIRDMAKMIYDRTNQFKYLILFGDGSFDFRDIYNIEINSRFIPVFETVESLNPIEAFPTDDYFALLSMDEGQDLEGALDIAVGRIPVKTAFEAEKIVDKIIKYDTSFEALGDWRNNITYVADDEDKNTHIDQADQIATLIDTSYHKFNINKIYLDAFRQESSSGGDAYPDAQASLNSSIFKGQLVCNYLGHGGPTGWAQERVLLVSDINNWSNEDKLPLFITATCSFTAYDDPERVSAGELVYLNENGGGIGLFTTSRAVYSNANKRLTEATFNHLFEQVDGEYPTLGEILRLAKNSNSQDTSTTNARKFALIGDPTQHLALPEYDVVTQEINDQVVSGLDTLSALQEVTISGFIADKNGNLLNNFNGIIYPTVFDKEQTITTLVNDPIVNNQGSREKEFQLQKNILFKGSATVTQGVFKFSFIVPKDIDYEYGRGRISYYAHDGVSKDAAGSYEDIIIGGTADNPISDDTPPLVEVFMNNEEFVFGGITNQNPIILVKLTDDFGINVAGTGIGHDLTAVLDENTQNTIIMNDFYEAEVDNFKKGQAQYPLSNLEPGLHTITVKGWDIANNSGEGYTEFLVEDNAEVALDHVLNYPNPFTTQTEFQFEHNQVGRMLRVQVNIFTISGKLVKTIHEDVFADGNRITGINWDGRDDYGDKIGRGVYLYKISIGNFANDNLNQIISSEFEKLVILR